MALGLPASEKSVPRDVACVWHASSGLLVLQLDYAMHVLWVRLLYKVFGTQRVAPVLLW